MTSTEIQQAIDTALAEGRAAWRVTDQHGRPANSGKAEPLLIGEWSEERDPIICQSGWHTTAAPHRWRGCRVWLVEGEGYGGSEGDKSVWRRIRPLMEVDPAQCIDPSVYVRCAADLSGAELSGADLSGADLSGANLYRADLSGADFSGADFSGAYRPEGGIDGWVVNEDGRLEAHNA